ncbi:hypothetical protein [Streptomyces sp. NPDC004528]|uniref:hypothetical protein n=1 Tax=Streptomyces sp. NPDC004528 TaxID=3154550 RepID=UPI0033B5D2C7
MAFYRDADGAIWQDGRGDALYCVFDPEEDINSGIGIPVEPADVEENWGPLVEVRPVGWVPVEESTLRFDVDAVIRAGSDWTAIGGGLEVRARLDDPTGTIHVRAEEVKI